MSGTREAAGRYLLDLAFWVLAHDYACEGVSGTHRPFGPTCGEWMRLASKHI